MDYSYTSVVETNKDTDMRYSNCTYHSLPLLRFIILYEVAIEFVQKAIFTKPLKIFTRSLTYGMFLSK